MSLADEISDEGGVVDRAELIKARRARAAAEQQLVRISEELEKTQKALSLVETLDGSALQPPKWLSPAKPVCPICR